LSPLSADPGHRRGDQDARPLPTRTDVADVAFIGAAMRSAR